MGYKGAISQNTELFLVIYCIASRLTGWSIVAENKKWNYRKYVPIELLESGHISDETEEHTKFGKYFHRLVYDVTLIYSTKQSKLKLYRAVILSVFSHKGETWSWYT
jgi:hypothetical protein